MFQSVLTEKERKNTRALKPMPSQGPATSSKPTNKRLKANKFIFEGRISDTGSSSSQTTIKEKKKSPFKRVKPTASKRSPIKPGAKMFEVLDSQHKFSDDELNDIIQSENTTTENKNMSPVNVTSSSNARNGKAEDDEDGEKGDEDEEESDDEVVTFKEVADYEPFIPVTRSTKEIQAKCRGCNSKFFRNSQFHYQPEYYIHCIKDCNKYKKLKLIRACDSCKFLFVNPRSYSIHKCSRESLDRPKWMPHEIYYDCLKTEEKKIKKPAELKTVRCPGCSKKFVQAVDRATDSPTLEFFKHLFEQCPSFDSFDCDQCELRFLDNDSFKKHLRPYHGDRPSWMSEKIYKFRFCHDKTMKNVPCLGCKQTLRRGRLYRFEDYVHMIEECPKYRDLNVIETCERCECKFINTSSFNKHVCDIEAVEDLYLNGK